MTRTDTGADGGVGTAARFARRLPVVAAGAMLLWVAVEVFARRVIAPRLAGPLGTEVGAGVVVGVEYLGLLVVAVGWLGTRAGIGPAAWAYTRSLRDVGGAVAGVIVTYLLRFGSVLVLTAGFGLALPTGGDPLGLDTAPTWALFGLLLVNGLLVPVAEEFAWRGVIQTALTEAYGTVVAVVVTATAFVLKHLVVDLAASPFRVAALVALATVLGVVRARYGTTSSTLVHVTVNGIETSVLVVAAL